MKRTSRVGCQGCGTAAGLAALGVMLGLMALGRTSAQSFTVLHDFSVRGDVPTNDDGAVPFGGLVANPSGTVLYGTANLGGSQGFGTVFALATDGTGFTTLHSFGPYSEGTQPMGGLAFSDGRLFGTAWRGGPSGNGTVFAVNADGTGFTNLLRFSAATGFGEFAVNGDGALPRAGVVVSGSRLFGAAEYGGRGGNGTVFAINADGTGFSTLHSFAAGGMQSSFGNYTNIGGIRPRGTLVLGGDTLYGTALGGGKFARGTVFKIRTDGSGFAALHHFTRADFDPVSNPLSANSDGSNPVGGLTLAGDILYGTTEGGGAFGQGVVFKIGTDGSGFTTLHSFFHSRDGYFASSGLVASGGHLYGAATGGGRFGGGTVFGLGTDGTGFEVFHHFIADSDGTNPGSLIVVGNSIYGPAQMDGRLDNGTLFRLAFAPPLTISRSESGALLMLSWPTRTAGFDASEFTVESRTTLDPAAVWEASFLTPKVVDGRYTAVAPSADPTRLFRLTSP